jgi:hypothetical protein
MKSYWKNIESVPLRFSLPTAFLGLASVALAAHFVFEYGFLGGLLEAQDAWDHWRLNTEMRAAGILPPSPEETDGVSRQPAIHSTSPDGAWTLNATWVDRSGYDWVLINTRTGRNFPQGVSSPSLKGGFATRLEPLWSPGGQYLALNQISPSGRDMIVLNLAGSEPRYVGAPAYLGSPRDGPEFPIDPDDASMGTWGQSERSKAIRWLNNADLAAVVLVEVSLGTLPDKIQPYRIETGANVVLRLKGNSVFVPEAKRIFYRKFITDL